MTAYIVDTVQVKPDDLDAYVALVHRTAVPVMTRAGAGFVSCWATSPKLGEDVDVQVTWSFPDHIRWNEIRKNLVLDRDWHALAHSTAGMRSGGSRRFFYPTEG